MRHTLPHFALAAALLLSAPALANGEERTIDTTPDTTPAAQLDLSRYLGLWHETARFDSIFERGLHAVTALYERMADDRIRVTNAGTAPDGQRYDVVGEARQVEGSTGGDLEVSFVPPYMAFFSDYRILYVTPDYSGALVSDEDGNMLWLLERDETSNPEVRERLLEEARQRGFDTSELIYDAALDSEAAIDSE